jgi:hypothetical protein
MVFFLQGIFELENGGGLFGPFHSSGTTPYFFFFSLFDICSA